MHHSFLDKYSNLNTIIHRLDPRTKIFAFGLFIVLVVLMNSDNKIEFAGYFTIMLALIVLSKVPFYYILKRSAVIVPFVLFASIFAAAINHNFQFFFEMFFKAFLTVLTMIVLSSTTKFSCLLKGLEKIKCPGIFIMLLTFMYRYIFILMDEAMNMQRAWEARFFGGQYFRQIKIFSNITACLFIRAYERGERVYNSMEARGFDGSVKTVNLLKFTKYDFIFGSFFIFGIAAIKILCVKL